LWPVLGWPLPLLCCNT